MPRVIMLIFSLGCVLTACQKSIKSKEQVRSDLMEYFATKVGLDLKVLDVDVTKVTFVDDQARATVSFHQKNNPAIDGGMVMMYTLEPKKGHWVVTSRADSQGRGFGASGGNQMPTGHPAIPEASTPGQGQLPPGHPSVDDLQARPPAGAPKGRMP